MVALTHIANDTSGTRVRQKKGFYIRLFLRRFEAAMLQKGRIQHGFRGKLGQAIFNNLKSF